MTLGSALGALVPAAVASAMWGSHRQAQRDARLHAARLQADADVRRWQQQAALRRVDRGTERIDVLEVWWRLEAVTPPHERGSA